MATLGSRKKFPINLRREAAAEAAAERQIGLLTNQRLRLAFTRIPCRSTSVTILVRFEFSYLFAL